MELGYNTNERKEFGYNTKERKFLVPLHGIALAIHLVSSIFAFLKVGDLPLSNANITFTKYSYAANSPPYVTTSSDLVGDTQNPIVWVAWNETITWMGHLAALIIITRKSFCGNDSRVVESARRWFSYAITAGLLQVALVLSLGPVPLFMVIYIMVNNAVVQILGGFMVDQEKSPQKRKTYLVIGGALFLVSAAYIALSCLTVEGLNTETMSITYNGLAIIYILFYMSFAIVQIVRQRYPRGPMCAMLHADGVFVLLSITSKVVLSWTMISIIYAGAEGLGMYVPTDNWALVQTFVVGLSANLLFLGLVANVLYFNDGITERVLSAFTTDIQNEWKRDLTRTTRLKF